MYFLKPVFGWDPEAPLEGEWIPPDGYDARCGHFHLLAVLGACICLLQQVSITASPHPPCRSCLASCSFVDRFGVLFEMASGPESVYRPGTFEWDPVTGTFDRGEMVPLTHTQTRAMKARHIAKVSSARLAAASE